MPMYFRRQRFVTQRLLHCVDSSLKISSVLATRTASMSVRTTTIVDTDIGDYIDDSWALASLLRSPILDLRLVLTCYGDHERHRRRSNTVATLLRHAEDSSRIAIGVGVEDAALSPHPEWSLKGYGDENERVLSHPGGFHLDGIDQALELLREAKTLQRPVVYICIAPFTNLAELVRQASVDELSNCTLVAMAGSVCRGYDGSDVISAEANVAIDPVSARSALRAPFRSINLVPLDVTWNYSLPASLYMTVQASDDPLAKEVVAMQRASRIINGNGEAVLYDVVAVLHAEQVMTCSKSSTTVVVPVRLQITENGLTQKVPVEEDSSDIHCKFAKDWLEGGMAESLRSTVQRILGRAS